MPVALANIVALTTPGWRRPSVFPDRQGIYPVTGTADIYGCR